MTSISGASLSNITPQLITPRDTIAAQQAARQPATTVDTEKVAGVDDAGAGTGPSTGSTTGTTTRETDHSPRIQGPKLSAGAAGADGAAQGSDDSNDSVVLKTIKEQIAQIQKQLAVVMQQIQSIQAGNMDERSKANALGGLQAQANMLNGALQQAMGKLAEAIQQQGASAVGNNVDTTA